MSVGFLSSSEKVFIFEHYFRSYGVGRHIRDHYEEQHNKTAPSNKTILAIFEKFHRTESVLCQRKRTTGRPRTVTTNENHERFLQQVLQYQKRCLRRSSLKLGVSDRSVRRMFKELGGFACHIQVAHRLTKTDGRARLQYCSRVLSLTYGDPDFFSNTWFSDESHIHLNGYVNRQTTRFLGFERPDVVIQKPLHRAQVTIWCAVSGHVILGPYFVEDEAQNSLSVNQERYREIIAAFARNLKRFCRDRSPPLRRQWMQQDRAIAYTTAGDSLAYLQQHFCDRLISRGTEFPFPSHSQDITAPDA